jgi:hypothetical protein
VADGMTPEVEHAILVIVVAIATAILHYRR